MARQRKSKDGRSRPPLSPKARAVGLLSRREHGARELKAKLVQRGIEADDAEAANDARGDGRDHGMVPEGFALVDIRDVNLDHRNIERGERIVNGDGGVRIGARIDDDAGAHRPRFLNPVDEFALMVRLVADHGKAERLRARCHLLLDRGKRGRTVDVRFAAPQQIEVRPVQHIDRLRDCLRLRGRLRLCLGSNRFGAGSGHRVEGFLGRCRRPALGLWRGTYRAAKGRK